MRVPKHFLLELTYRCNHHCLFCSCPWIEHSQLRGAELPVDEWKKIVRKLFESGVRFLTLSGGEPLLKDEFCEILIYTAELPFESVCVFSNGKNVDSEILDLFCKYHIQWATSVPGIFSFKHLTGSDMSVRQLLDKIKQAAKKKIYVAVSITGVRRNLKEIPLTVMLARLYGASAIALGPCMPEGRALEYSDLWLTNREYHLLLSMANLFNSCLKIPVTFSYEQRCLCYNIDGTPTNTVPESCNAGKDFMVVAPDGGVRKCMHSPERICSIKEYFSKEAL